MKVIAGKNQINAKLKSKERYDSKIKTFNAKVGDYAYVLREPRTRKFDDFYGEPLKMVDVSGRKNVILELPNGKRIRKHIDKLKPAPKRNN